MLLNYLYSLFPSSISKISYSFHDGKAHGINLAQIPTGTTLVIAPDSSSNDYDIHKELRERGIDVLVLDHHQADYVSPDALIVNNQLCDYPNKALSGVGIVYKLCQELDKICGDRRSEEFIDLVMLGLVGDMADARNLETFYYIQTGMAHPRNPFIVEMATKNSYSLKGTLTPMGVAFYIVPFINATTRVGKQEEKELLFKSMLEWEANRIVPSTKRGCAGQTERLVEQAVRTCTNIKNRQTKIRDSGVEVIENLIEDNNLLDHKLLIVQLAEGAMDRGVVGLIANELISKYQRPVIILTKTTHEGQDAWEGSARGYEKSKFTDFRGFCKDSGYFYLAEGHPSAWGAGILDENLYDFIRWSDDKLSDIEFSPSYNVDFIYPATEVSPQDILTLAERHDIWSQNIDEPLIAVERVNVTKDMIYLMSRDKNPTIKIKLPNGVDCIKFKSSEEEYNNLCSDIGSVTLNLVGRPERNEYLGNVSPQILITDYEVTHRGYYF